MFYLGVDGGGTTTTAILCDARGDNMRTFKTGPGNIAVLDLGSMAQLLRNIIDGLMKRKEINKIIWGTFAFAGAGRITEKETVASLIAGLGLKNFTVITDAEILYYSIFGEKQGILVTAGTGSTCLIRNNMNQLRQIGGWGYLLGDAGSGFDIGSKAIRAAVHETELGNRPSALTNELVRFYGLKQPEKLITVTYSSVNPQYLIASCAKIVCEQAARGEPNAVKIVEDAADALLDLVRQGIEQLDDREKHKVALAGSILKEDSVINHMFRKKARELNYCFEYVREEMHPAAAAVIHSFRESGKSPSKMVLAKLKQIVIA